MTYTFPMDLALKSLDNGYFDIEIDGGTDIMAAGGLNTAVLLSIFARAAVGDEEGYWGDYLSAFANDTLGSRLWEISTRSNTQNNRLEAVAAIKESLAWLIDDSVAEIVNVEITRLMRNEIHFRLEIVNFTDGRPSAFTLLWDVHRARILEA